MNGWCGVVVHIDLTNKTVRRERPEASVYQCWIGGRGLAGYYVYPFIQYAWDDPAVPFVMMTGPLVGTASPTSGRMAMMSRSPLTGTVGDCSVGGRLGTALKKAGLDGRVSTGRSETACGLEIVDDTITFHHADDLAGQPISMRCRQLNDKGAVAVIGSAAEQKVLFANIMVDGAFAAGRNGLGCVWAAKNLKYVTVQGSGQTAVHDKASLKQAREEIFRLIAASPILMGEHGIAQYGTGALYDLMDTRHMMPTANFRRTRFDAAGAMNAHAFKKKYSPRREGCQGCHILCKKRGRGGRSLPEFETMSHFSALLENRDIEIVTEAHQVCNEMGMDTISAGATLACYAEIHDLHLSGPQIIQALRDMGSGQGAGARLGQGAYRYAVSRGRVECAATVKKQELAAYDPRGAYGMALAYAMSTRGACHLRAYPISHEILRKPVATDRFTFAGKARIIKIAEDMNAVVDSLTACKFVFFAGSLEEYAHVYTAVTGVEVTARDLLSLGECICYRERMMNALNGFSSVDDDLPARFFTEPGSSGNDIEIKPLDRRAFLQARAAYYQIRGLDAGGMPTKEKADSLGLTWMQDQKDEGV